MKSIDSFVVVKEKSQEKEKKYERDQPEWASKCEFIYTLK